MRKSITLTSEHKALLSDLKKTANRVVKLNDKIKSLKTDLEAASTERKKKNIQDKLTEARAEKSKGLKKRRDLAIELDAKGVGCSRAARELGVVTMTVYAWANGQKPKPHSPTGQRALNRKLTEKEIKRINSLLDKQRELIAKLEKVADDQRVANDDLRSLRKNIRYADSTDKRRTLRSRLIPVEKRRTHNIVAASALRDKRDALAAKLSDLGYGAPRQSLALGEHSTAVARWIKNGRDVKAAS